MREQSTENARSWLERFGYSVADIAVAPQARRAELVATLGPEYIVVEAKDRDPHGLWTGMQAESRASGSATLERTVRPWAAIGASIREAYDQLVATPAPDEAFRVMWRTALHDDSSFVLECVEMRLLGSVYLSVFRGFEEPFDEPCCYRYDISQFERSPEMVAAVVASSRGSRLLVDFDAPDRSRFRETKLYRAYAEAAAVMDPELEADAGRALMIGPDFADYEDSDGDRSQWAYLRDRYGVLTSRGIESQFDGMLTIPASAFESESE